MYETSHYHSHPNSAGVTVVGAPDALEVFLNDMRYINPRFTYLLYLLYLQTQGGWTIIGLHHVSDV